MEPPLTAGLAHGKPMVSDQPASSLLHCHDGHVTSSKFLYFSEPDMLLYTVLLKSLSSQEE